MTIEIRLDDLASEATQTLIAAHLSGMHESSPPESVHALDIDSLRHPSVMFWSAWIGARQQAGGVGRSPIEGARQQAGGVGRSPIEGARQQAGGVGRSPIEGARQQGAIAGIGALKLLDHERGEIKSMRVADGFRGTGVGRALLRHIIAEARERGLTSLWLETGTTPDFAPARRLYVSEGFVECGPFEGYSRDPFSVFMTRAL
jgi:putative acetyltransferase